MTCCNSQVRNKYGETVYKDHNRDQQIVVLIHRCSLYAGSITWKVDPWGPGEAGGLYKQVVYRACLTVQWSLHFKTAPSAITFWS